MKTDGPGQPPAPGKACRWCCGRPEATHPTPERCSEVSPGWRLASACTPPIALGATPLHDEPGESEYMGPLARRVWSLNHRQPRLGQRAGALFAWLPVREVAWDSGALWRWQSGPGGGQGLTLGSPHGRGRVSANVLGEGGTAVSERSPGASHWVWLSGHSLKCARWPLGLRVT